MRNDRRIIPWIALLAAAPVALARAEDQPAVDAPSPASASVSASVSASPPPLPLVTDVLGAQGLPAEGTPAPSPATWKSAPLLALEPRGNPWCTAQLVRDWLRVRCDRGDIIDITQLVGDARGVALSVAGPELERTGEAIVQLRPGHDVALTFTAASFGRYSSGLPESVGLLWVLWPAHASRPVVRLE